MSLLTLKEGKMTGREIAEWLNIDYIHTYSRNPKKHLEKLKDYCDYEQVRGGAIISNIKIPYYYPNITIKDTETYTKEIERCIKEHEGLASISGIAKVAQKTDKMAYGHYTDNQVYYRMKKTGQELFGDAKPKNNKPKQSGTIGSRYYTWAVKLDGDNNYRSLTSDELVAFDSCLSDYYSNLSVEKKLKRAEIEMRFFEKDDATMKEFKDELDKEEVNFVKDVLDKFRAETGLTVATATKHQLFNK